LTIDDLRLSIDGLSPVKPDAETKTPKTAGAIIISAPFGVEGDWRIGTEGVRHSHAHADRFTAALCREIAGRGAELRGREFATVSFSVGASLLSLDQLYRIIQTLYDSVSVVPQEQTIAVAAGAVDEARAKVLRESGFDRAELRMGGGRSEAADFRVLREAGFTSVGCELEYAATGDAWAQMLDAALRLEPDHVALGMPAEGNVPGAAPGLLQAFRLARERLSAGYRNYALHCYCRPDHESHHVVAVLADQPLAGFGPGAVTRLGTEEASNPARMADYLFKVEKGKRSLSAARPAAASRLKNDLARLAGVPESGVNGAKAKALIGRGLLASRDGGLFLTDEGVVAIDSVCRELTAG
jgi:coproporphyrinogen III oxidase-like Fe-S oxidoreductase